MRTLTLKLLPLEVPLDSISDPTSRIITPQVVDAYITAAGDFTDVVSVSFLLCDFYMAWTHNISFSKLPYCLLRAHKEFIFDANHNPADYGENECRGNTSTCVESVQCLISF